MAYESDSEVYSKTRTCTLLLWSCTSNVLVYIVSNKQLLLSSLEAITIEIDTKLSKVE